MTVTPAHIGRLLLESLRRLDPRVLWNNPVLFLTWWGAVLATLVAVAEPFLGGAETSGGGALPDGFSWAIAVWVWLTLITANFAEALAEGLGRAQLAGLRSLQETVIAHRIVSYDSKRDAAARTVATREVDSSDLRPGAHVIVSGGDTIPVDGAVVWGAALVDESAITGESAPVIRESGGDRTGVTGGTRVLSDRIVVRVTARAGESAVDRMIALAVGGRRKKAPNELALGALIASLSFSFVLVALTLNVVVAPVAASVSIPILVALVVCLIPTEIAALLSVTGIAATYRLLRSNVVVTSSRALETAGDVTAVLLDKTGTVTQGDRRATGFLPLPGVPKGELVHAAVLASTGDPTSEGTSTIELAAAHDPARADAADAGRFVAFSAETRMSGVDLPDGTSYRKGAESAVLAWLKRVGTQQTRQVVDELRAITTTIAGAGGTPLVVAVRPAEGGAHLLGVIELKDVVKPIVPERVGRLRALGIRTVMVTGDNPLTAKAIAAEAGVDDYLGDATPEGKLALIVREQEDGHFVAMSGDGANDAPALAQADVGVSMNTATRAAKDAANMIVLDDDPTRIVDIVEAGRNQMATRGALTTFNFANDVVRYVAMFPALFVGTFPGLASLNLLGLHSPASAILSTLIFSVVVMGILIPLALVGVPYRMADLGRALTRNLVFYGLGGVVVAAVGIKLIDLVVGLVPGY